MNPFKGIIPDRFSCGGQLYEVSYITNSMNDHLLGTSSVFSGEVKIHTEYTEGKISKDSMCNTFWHEVTHQVLENMGYDELSNDEKFVTAFAGMLNEAIQSSEMKEEKQ